MCRLLPALLVLFLLLPAPGRAFDRSPEGSRLRDTRRFAAVRLSSLQTLRRFTAGVAGTIAVQPSRGAPSSLRGDAPVGEDLGVRLAEALPEGVELDLLQEQGGHRRFGFRIQGLPVFPDVVTLSERGSRWMLSGRLPDPGNVQLRGGVTEEEAVAQALQAGAIEESARTLVQPVLFDAGQEGLRAAHLVEIHARRPPGHLQVVVDLEDGKVRFLDDLSSRLERTEYQGIAGVYRTHPGDGPPSEEPISHLTRTGKLRGTRVEVSNEDTTTDASGTNQRFVYPPDSKHLDEAMVYYHIDRAADFFEALGGVENVHRPMPAGVYYGDQYDNAMFLSWAPAIVFGDGHRYHPLSREAAVIIHEYTHAVTYGMTQMGSMGDAGALNEGFSDYFAAVLTDDPVIGEYVVAPTGRPYMRTLLNELRTPEDRTGESHDDSRIFSGALWKLRQAVGGEVADRLVHESRPYLNRESGFEEALGAILEVDRVRHDGIHAEAIRSAFARHGIVEGGASW